MKKRSRKRYVNIWTIAAVLLVGVLLVVFATRDLRRFIFTGEESMFVRITLTIIIYVVPTIMFIYIGDKAMKYDMIKKKEKNGTSKK